MKPIVGDSVAAPLAACTELYVYYRLNAGDAAAAFAAFEAARGGASVRLLQRYDRGDDDQPTLVTWMEIYGTGLRDAAALEQVVASALRPFVKGERHVEVFAGLPTR